jgi:hypothetical protein
MEQGSETQPLVPKPEETMKVEARVGFVRKVYGILSVQLLLTVLISAPFAVQSTEWVDSHAWVLYVSLAAMISCMCVMMCCGQMLRSYPQNYIFLFVFTALMSVNVGFVSALYTWQSVTLAAGATMAIFLLLTCYAFFTTSDFTGYGPYLFTFLAVLSVFGLILSMLSLAGIEIKWLTMLYDVFGVMLFCFYIVFDTQMMMGDWGGHKVQFSLDDYCFAALNLYLDIINLFLHLLSLLGSRK